MSDIHIARMLQTMAVTKMDGLSVARIIHDYARKSNPVVTSSLLQVATIVRNIRSINATNWAFQPAALTGMDVVVIRAMDGRHAM